MDNSEEINAKQTVMVKSEIIWGCQRKEKMCTFKYLNWTEQ